MAGFTHPGRPGDKSYTAKQLASVLDVSLDTLERWRNGGMGPKFYKLGTKLVRYMEGDIIEWLEEKRR